MKVFLLATLTSLVGLFPFLVGSPPAGTSVFQDDWLEPGDRQHVQALSFDGKEFFNAFNAADDRARLVIVFSPT